MKIDLLFFNRDNPPRGLEFPFRNGKQSYRGSELKSKRVLDSESISGKEKKNAA
jgi:hypothetical protein